MSFISLSRSIIYLLFGIESLFLLTIRPKYLTLASTFFNSARPYHFCKTADARQKNKQQAFVLQSRKRVRSDNNCSCVQKFLEKVFKRKLFTIMAKEKKNKKKKEKDRQDTNPSRLDNQEGKTCETEDQQSNIPEETGEGEKGRSGEVREDGKKSSRVYDRLLIFDFSKIPTMKAYSPVLEVGYLTPQ